MTVVLTILDVLGYILFYIVMVTGALLIPIGLPGEFLIVAAALVFTLVAGSSVLPWWVFAVLLGLALLAEAIEGMLGFAGAKAKGSFWSACGAVVGGLVGAVLGTMVAALVGSVVGALLGTFLGAFVIEYEITRHRVGAAKVATGALIGRILGSVAKLAIAFAMIALVTLVLIV